MPERNQPANRTGLAARTLISKNVFFNALRVLLSAASRAARRVQLFFQAVRVFSKSRGFSHALGELNQDRVKACQQSVEDISLLRRWCLLIVGGLFSLLAIQSVGADEPVGAINFVSPERLRASETVGLHRGFERQPNHRRKDN
jgi:hypothetical protein